MEEVRSNTDIKVCDRFRKANNPIAGADISMLNTVTTVEEGVALSKQGQQAMNDLAAFPCLSSQRFTGIVWVVV